MPELPEVETVKKMLEPDLVGKVFARPKVFVKRAIGNPLEEYCSGVEGRKVLSLSRRGKYLLLHLDEDKKLLFHFRMEGKLYIVSKEPEPRHLSIYLPFQGEQGGLAFFDTRKFGISILLNENEDGPLSKLGPEPWGIQNSSYLYTRFHRSEKPIKELLLDQTLISGIGNIYANEILFASSVSPFKPGKKITKEEAERILENAKKILADAISHHGSTIRSYHPSADSEGEFQNILKVYGKQGEECPRCHKTKIEKLFLGGRGTEFCPHCQHTGISLGITGKIASGKSLATKYFGQCGFVTFSCDEEVHKLYQDEAFLKVLKAKFPVIFTPALDKGKITSLLQNDSTFRRRYETFLYAKLRERINDFLIANDGKNKALEIPLLFESRFDKLVTYKVGVETTRQKAHLKERGEKADHASFNRLNSYDKHRNQLDFILHTDGPKKELKHQVKELIEKLADSD